MNRFLAAIGWLVLPALALAQDTETRDTHEMRRLHQDSKAYIAMLDDPARDAYQKPHDVITALKLKQGEVIADIDLEKEMDRNGFRLETEHTFLPYQYLLVFKLN